MYYLLPKSTTRLRRKGEQISIKDSYLKLRTNRTDTIIGWYVFKGRNNTGYFSGKGVSSHVKTFLDAGNNILDAFPNLDSLMSYHGGCLAKWRRIYAYFT